MENLTKVFAESENRVENNETVTVWNIGNKFMGRSLVALNRKSGAIYNIAAKCRNTDKVSVTKSLVKAYLAVLREAEKANNTAAAIASGKRVTNRMAPVLGCHVLYVTDKDGHILKESGVEVKGVDAPLRDVFRFSKSQPLYIQAVEKGLAWENPDMSILLSNWCTAAVEQLDFADRCDKAILKAANSTEKEQKAAEEVKTAKESKDAAEKVA